MINRRWDPCLWRDQDKFFIACLAADYSEPWAKNTPWFMQKNVMELWTGESLQALTLVHSVPSAMTPWTAPSYSEGHLYAGKQYNSAVPRQWLMEISPKDFSLIVYSDMPKPPPQLYSGDTVACRDPWRVSQDLMIYHTGGFRWRRPPNVWLAESNINLHPVIDPALALQWGEMERPQIHFVEGRQLLTFSCWPEHTLLRGGPVHVLEGDDFVFHKYLGTLAGANFGFMVYEGFGCGWRWIDRDRWSSTLVFQELSPNWYERII